MRKARQKLIYSDQLRDARWIQKRDSIIKRDTSRCIRCCATSHLDVHHTYYENDGRSAWEYDDESLVTLCRSCHNYVHQEFDKITALISIQIIKKGMSFTDVAFKLGIL
jgi:5-methylcytosine-specific restriction endonuclease McrA